MNPKSDSKSTPASNPEQAGVIGAATDTQGTSSSVGATKGGVGTGAAARTSRAGKTTPTTAAGNGRATGQGTGYGTAASYGSVGTTGDRYGTGGGYGQVETEDLHQPWSQVAQAASRFTDALHLRERLEKHPYATLALAFGVGYLLANRRFLPVILGIGLRAAATPYVKNEFSRIFKHAAGTYGGGEPTGYGSAASS